MASGGPFRILNGLLNRIHSLSRLVLRVVLWAILLVFAAIVLVPMLLQAARGPALVLPSNETREQIYNLACSKGLSGGSLAERELIWRRRSLVELSHPIRVVLASQPYDIPWGYYASRPNPTSFNCPPRKQANLQYWIPSLDMPESQISNIGNTNRPKERAKPNPRSDESVVEAFWIVGYDDDRSHGRRTIEWLKEASQLDGRSPGSVEEHGLWHTVVPIGSLQMTYWYKFGPGEDVVIECYAPFQRCEGNVDLKDLRMFARLSFDKDAIPQHQVIVDGLRTLLSRWRSSS
ncbi:hypothetical protein ACU8V1_14225 [Rhizobium leguminosarum]|uniref:Uncharacterized protein n=1 Tax=Rhizobium leguminosarum TaxID=384 RepID=A0A2Z4YIG3_RHILE|nr:hypothetical protein [Rhizobium leguminosarum]AXA39855.1 hypothetical protein DLJ82_2262 [Rhizobium leguminosarum]WHO80508.1 hypothetical protein QMO81_003224 [Rhizobium leguminosarum]